MAFLYVTEYASMGQIVGAQMPDEASILAAYRIAITGASVKGQVVNPRTRFIELHTDAICSVAINIDPSADATARRMNANQTIYRGVPEGGSFRVAVITNT